MNRNHILGMICGYYLSRFDKEAYAHLGFSTRQATHEGLGTALGVPATSIKNWRDEFDPIHDNPRKGWHKREMRPYPRRVVEALGHLTESELFELVSQLTIYPYDHISNNIVIALTELDSGREKDLYSLRGLTGIQAEEAFCQFHEQSGEPISGKLLDRRYDQCGYDFEIIADPISIAVEVKGLAGQRGGITFTHREWKTARLRGESYYLAIVRNVATTPQISLLRNPAANLNAEMRTYTTIQVTWSVGEQVIRSAESARGS